jgi:hypothetical protein
MKRAMLFLVCMAAIVPIAEGGIQIDFGPVYPAPGGNNFAFWGNGLGMAGGENIDFSGINLSQEAALYWGPSKLDLFGSPPTGLSMHSQSTILPDEVFGLAGDSQVSLTSWRWLGTSQIVPASGPAQNIATRMTITISNDLTGAWVQDAATLGLDTAYAKPRALWHVTSSSFTANILMEAQSPTNNSWLPYNDLIVALWTENWGPQNGNTCGSFTGGFYGTIPEPATLVVWSLLGSLAITVGRRRMRAA